MKSQGASITRARSRAYKRGWLMETVQITIEDTAYASALRELLQRNGKWDICCVAAPDPQQPGVIVIDSDGLDRLGLPLIHPERMVLITRNDPPHLAQAWNTGIRSVVFNEDPLSTAVLAIMAAELRVSRADSKTAPPGCTASCAGVEAAPGTKSRERRG